MTADPIEKLAELGQRYRHVQVEHERETPRGSTRRRLRQDMTRIVAQFDGLLERWVPDTDERAAWRAYLHGDDRRPATAPLAPPPLFRGHTNAGALIEVRAADDGGYDVLVDGARSEHHTLPWELEPERIEPIQVGPWSCVESFHAPDRAVTALREAHAQPGSTPPWRWARQLFEDGLIDADFAVTARGARCLRRGAHHAPTGGRFGNYCVLLANAGRARVLALADERTDEGTTRLTEVADTRDPASRARDSERFSDTRPGLRRGGQHGPRHGVSDRRQAHRRESERRFAESVAEHAARAGRAYASCTMVVVAGPQMLGQLRTALARHLRDSSGIEVVELARDLTPLAAPAVHDALARAGILPPPGRRRPVKPMRTPNPWAES